MNKKLIASLLLVGLIFVSCDRRAREVESEKVEGNVLREHISTPKDDARAVTDSLEALQNSVHQQVEELDE